MKKSLIVVALAASVLGAHSDKQPVRQASVSAQELRRDTQGRPNVVVFFVDDMGYGELGCYGSKDLRTPHIDGLAQNGVRCTAGYVTAPSCGPSRAGMMTGHYQQRFGYEINPEKEFRETFGLDLNYQTIGGRMQAAGYKTGAIGKWDLGRGVDFNPINRGFDFYYGHIVGARHYWPMKKGPELMALSCIFRLSRILKPLARPFSSFWAEH